MVCSHKEKKGSIIELSFIINISVCLYKYWKFLSSLDLQKLDVCLFPPIDCHYPMHLTLCLWAQSWAFTNSGVRSLASLLPLTMQPTSHWHWPNIMQAAPAASVATSTLWQLMNILLRKVCACHRVHKMCESESRESSLLLEWRKWFESPALKSRKSNNWAQEKITK